MAVARPPASIDAMARTGKHRRIVIAGGGVAALEALLGIRDVMGEVVEVELVSASPEFVYRPVTVTEPFRMGEAPTFALEDLAHDLNARLRIDAVTAVDADAHVAHTRAGAELPYDALLAAPGARALSWLNGALTFRGRADVEALRALLRDLDAGRLCSLAFAGVPGGSWQLPLYELALLTASHVADERLGDVELVLVTPEDSPLAAFGPRASDAVRQLLADRGIQVHAASYPAEVGDGYLRVVPGQRIPADRVVTLPRLEGPRLAGLPQDEDGFIPTDEHGRVGGVDDVYAAGDGTSFPVKQGGIAAQQADAAVATLAASFGVDIAPQPFKPVLRGMLLTGLGPTYLRSDVSGRAGDDSEADTRALWWPPAKIAGDRLAPYLAQRISVGRDERLSERHPPQADDSAVATERRAARDLFLALADSEGRWGQYEEAIRALEAALALDGTLPPEYVAKGCEWRAARAAGRTERSES
jgi:sulfide:quinone oxidoreductase